MNYIFHFFAFMLLPKCIWKYIMTQPKNYFKDFMEHNPDLSDDDYLKLFLGYLLDERNEENSSEENSYFKNLLYTITNILCIIREIISKRENGENSIPDLFFMASLVNKFCNALDTYENDGKKFTLDDFDNIAKFLLDTSDMKSIKSRMDNRYTNMMKGISDVHLTLAERFDEGMRELDKIHHNFENNIDLEADFQNNLPLRQSSLKVMEILKIFLVTTKEEYCNRNLGI